MQQKLKNEIEKPQIKKMMIAVIIVLVIWFLFVYFFSNLLFFSMIPFTILVVCGIYFSLPDKYLIIGIFLMAITHDTVLTLIGEKRQLDWKLFFLSLNFYSFIFMSFLIFGIRIIQNEPIQNTISRKDAIIKKLLWLIIITIASVNAYGFIQNTIHNYNYVS